MMPGWNDAQTIFMVPPTLLAAPQQQVAPAAAGQVVVAPQNAAPQIAAMTSLDPCFQPLPLQPGETAFYPSGERKRAKQACMACHKAKLRCTMLQCGSCLYCVERGWPCIPRVRMTWRQTRKRPPYPSLDLARAQEAALQSLPPLPPLQPMPPSAVGLEDLWGGAQGLQPGSPTVGSGAGLPAAAPVAAPDQATLIAALCSSYSMHLQRSLADSMSLSRMLAAESSTETLEAPQDEHRAPPLAQLVGGGGGGGGVDGRAREGAAGGGGGAGWGSGVARGRSSGRTTWATTVEDIDGDEVSLKRPRDTREYTKDHDSFVDEVARREVEPMPILTAPER